MLASFSNDPSLSNVVYGFKNYTELELGNLNILLSVPHDGSLRPPEIPNRENDLNGNLKNDKNTRRFTKSLKNELEILFFTHQDIKLIPFVLYNNLHRIKMDPNRDLENCCHITNQDAHTAYKDYHSMIEICFRKNFVLSNNFDQGLILDIHGNSHEEQWIELGYLLKKSDLENDKLSNSLNTSIRSMASKSFLSLEEMIRGEKVSLGSLIETKSNIKVVPSPGFKSPKEGNYYSGGFITECHGSFYDTSKRLNSIQIELPMWMRTDKYIEFSAKHIAKAIFEFYELHSLNSLKI
ncbi:pglyrp1 isoform X3 [Brachionus plicatilis]|uniref:Pglyrp1 isoform X3 n=1 Tax=Brachionus plicatilis TaxID=10195 RepID=A0A3M7STD4_BRAPC|nr:pglyrp1 isoform X3 [Brachionus plicatilis]